jgi:hypothetical protein
VRSDFTLATRSLGERQPATGASFQTFTPTPYGNPCGATGTRNDSETTKTTTPTTDALDEMIGFGGVEVSTRSGSIRGAR